MPQLSYGGNMNHPDYGMIDQGMEPYNPQAGSGGSQVPLDFGNNLNYPSYAMPNTASMLPTPEVGSGTAGNVGNIADTAGNVAMAINPAFGLGLKAVGLGASIYDKYKQREQAKENYEMMMIEYKRRQAIEDEDRAREQSRQNRQESFYTSEFSQDLQNNLAGAYKGQRQPTGA